jgi:type II secretory ATPase GspE/PulE/Tfp pilus assembly ATPase PilB-like protein
MAKERCGELLIAAGKVTSTDVDQALKLQAQFGGKIGEILVNQGVCTEEDVLAVLAHQLDVPRLSVWDNIPSDAYSLNLYDMDKSWWLKQGCFPLGEKDGQIWIAMSDVLVDLVPEIIARKTGKPVVRVLSGGHELRQLLSLLEAGGAGGQTTDESLLQDLAAGAPIIKFVNETIQRAMNAKASDIHLETYRGIFRVRFRVDGVLHEVDRPGLAMQPAVVSRIKLMAGLDISEKRLPQDGRIRMKVGGVDLDIRVATTPGVAGENIVLRLLVGSGGGVQKLSDLSLQEDHRELCNQMLTATNGIILVTGPTGSGKSTTLYAFLRELMNDERKIITVEDPVEYQTNGITQIPVNAEIGLTFASVLRSVLRQDPDIVLIGEIRDRETAEIAVQAALTGHLVLSTLHTNDAPSAFVRLMDMGVESYLLASSVIGVMGQRLVRSVCSHCAEPDPNGLEYARSQGWDEITRLWPKLAENPGFLRARGCDHCLGSGYRGRQPIFEMLPVSTELRHMLATEPEQVARYVSQLNIRTLKQDGILKAARGETTISEVIRVTG